MKISILGTGAMGSRMAAALLQGGHAVTVWNRSVDRALPLVDVGATLAANPFEAAAGSDIVIAMVRDDQASRETWIAGGALAALSPAAIGIESSTVSVGWARELAALFAQSNKVFLDAPVLGSLAQAEARALIHLVGGDEAVFHRTAPVFAALGSAAHHVGPAGSGAALKLLANGLFAIQVAALAELLGAAVALGLSDERLVEVLGATPILSLAAKGAAQGILASAFAPAFPVELVEKDLGYLADAITDAPVSAAARSAFQRVIQKGFGAENITAISRLYD